jgi:hypothetical protein
VKFRIRPGFRAFTDHNAAAVFEATGAKSGIRPVTAGRIVNLTPEQASAILCSGRLGALEPVDDAARKFYGDTPAAVPAHETNPSLYAIRPEPERREFAVAGAR